MDAPAHAFYPGAKSMNHAGPLFGILDILRLAQAIFPAASNTPRLAGPAGMTLAQHCPEQRPCPLLRKK
jgi:hypothetical protein